MYGSYQQFAEGQLVEIRAAGTYKSERIITTPQGTTIRVSDGKPVLNLCANNYLGLAQHPAVIAAAREALDRWGFGMASVRFICGTQGVHKQLGQSSAPSSGPKTRSCIRPALTPMAVCSRLCWASRMPSSAMN